MSTEIQSLLRPEILNSLSGLELLSRMVIGAYLNGAHQSARSGQGQEFRQYRSYQPGDDLRLLDWKMYARSDRYYIREAEIESHVIVRFVLDGSASMQHEDQNGIRKLDFARLVIASLAYLAIEQGDSIGLYALNHQKLQQLRPQAHRTHFQRFLYELLQVEAVGVFPEPRENYLLESQRGTKEMIILLSDLYEKEQEILNTLESWCVQRNEVLAFHIMAENELKLNYPAPQTLEDWETGQKIQIDPKRARTAYQKSLDMNLERIQKQMLDLGITYELIAMHEPIHQALRQFLQRRKSLL